jgi:hypothetical protein
MTFLSEQDLVNCFVEHLQADAGPWGKVRFIREFDYSRGRTDIVALAAEGFLIAVEAKLTDWKYALHQAYRNTCFAHLSFVLLPKKNALRALQHVGEFEKRRVGLCYADGSQIMVLHHASRATAPIEPWLTYEALCGCICGNDFAIDR